MTVYDDEILLRMLSQIFQGDCLNLISYDRSSNNSPIMAQWLLHSIFNSGLLRLTMALL